MSARSEEAAHWPALDGLRGVAVLGVLVFHVRTDWLPGGFLGVDLFFALSGFLITTLLLRDLDSGVRAPLRRFWGRRFRRLLPAVMVMIAVVLAWTAIWGTPGEQSTARGDAAWAVPYLANWHLIDSARDYWASATADSPFTHLWSLAIEEQFYVVWPLVVWLLVAASRDLRACGHERPILRRSRPHAERPSADLRACGHERPILRRSRPHALVAATACAAIASVAAMVLLADDTTRAYMGTDTRACALLFGALFAMLPRPRWPASAPLACVAVLAAVWAYGGERIEWLLRGGLPLHSLVAALLVASLVGSRSVVARALSVRPLVWIGRISYGLYLWHWPVVRLGRARVADLPWLLEDAVLVAISFALAIASFHLVEHPIRRQLGWARDRRAAWATLATAALATATILVAPTGRGQVAAFDAASLTPPASPATGGDPANAACSAPGGTSAGPSGTSETSPAGNTANATNSSAEAPGCSGTVPSVDTANAAGTTVAGREAGSDAGPTGTSAASPASTSTSPAGSTATNPNSAATTTAGDATNPTAPNATDAVTTAPATAPSRVIESVLWIGDSIAADEAPAVIAALEAAGVRAVNGAFEARRLISSDGVEVEELYPPVLADAAADVVVVQLSLWDKAYTADELRSAFTWFAGLVADSGGELVFVTPPPLREEHAHPGLARQAVVAQQLAAAGAVTAVLDSSGAWGDVFSLDLGDDGAPDRKPDGVHVCPQGAARFAAWLVGELDRLFDGLSPAPPAVWAAGDWVTDPHYDTPVGACAPV